MSEKLTFAIYKYSHELILEDNNTENEEFLENSDDYLSSTVEQALRELKRRLDNKPSTSYTHFTIEEDSIQGIYFYSSNPPIWKSFVERSISRDETIDVSDFDISDNVSSSYIMFITHENSIYMITGGQGARYITPYIDGYFGIDVLPGLISQTDASVKGLENVNFSGNRQTEAFMNNKLTSLTDEISMRSLNKNLNIEIPLSKANEALQIDILENENSEKIIRVESKDSIVLHRGITGRELKNVIRNVDTIYNTRRNEYVLNYFLPAKKEKLTKKIIENSLTEMLAQGFTENFSIVGDNYYEYYTGADLYVLKDDNSRIILEKEDEEITLEDCYEAFDREDITVNKTFMRKFLKRWTLSTFDENGEALLLPVPILRVLQGLFTLCEERGDNVIATPLFLMNGEWFTLNKKYIETLNRRFESVYDENEELINELPFIELLQNRQNDDGITNETSYNDSFKDDLQSNIIVAHPRLIYNVEFADLITWDDDNIYFICIKDSFNGAGVRDLTNQMWASAQILNSIINTQNKTIELAKYYDKVKANYGEDHKFEEHINEDFFIELFDKNPVYIAGYIDNYRRDSEATYGKLLTIDYKNTFKRELDIEYLVVGDLIDE